MERFTHSLAGGLCLAAESAVHPAEGGYTGPAIERLAAFERFYEDLAAQQETLAAELEALRAAGKKTSVKFRELFAQKLTGSNILILLQTYGIGP